MQTTLSRNPACDEDHESEDEPQLFLWDCLCNVCEHEWLSHATEDGKNPEEPYCPKCGETHDVDALESREEDFGQELFNDRPS